AALKHVKGLSAHGRFADMLDAGVCVSLGGDSANGSNHFDMLRLMYLAALVPKDARLDPGVMPPERVLEMATIHGARALGLEREIGSLEPGTRGDLIVFDLYRPAARAPLAELAAVAAPAPVHVVIAGAGLAGLCAALELERRGHTCTILEAETRHVGGRARTLRFEGGLYGEAGAMRVPKSHTLTRHYVAELGLTLRPFVQSNPDAFMFMRGRRERVRDVTRLGAAYGLAAAEQGKSPEDLWAVSFVK